MHRGKALIMRIDHNFVTQSPKNNKNLQLNYITVSTDNMDTETHTGIYENCNLHSVKHELQCLRLINFGNYN